MNKKIYVAIGFLMLFLLLLTSCKTETPPVGEGTTEVLEDVTTAAPDTGVWHLELQTDRVLETISVPDELSGYAVKVPLKYTETINGIEFTIDFFEEYYPLGSLIQLSVSVTNNSGVDIEFIGNNSPGSFSNGKQHIAIVGIIINQGPYYAINSVEMETIGAGETKVYERLYFARPDFFKPDEKIIYFFDTLGAAYRIELPVEVVEIK